MRRLKKLTVLQPALELLLRIPAIMLLLALVADESAVHTSVRSVVNTQLLDNICRLAPQDAKFRQRASGNDPSRGQIFLAISGVLQVFS